MSRAFWKAAARAAEERGAAVVPVRVPDIGAMNTVGRIIVHAEASAIYERWLGERDMFGDDVLALLDEEIHGETGHRIVPEYKQKRSTGPLASAFLLWQVAPDTGRRCLYPVRYPQRSTPLGFCQVPPYLFFGNNTTILL